MIITETHEFYNSDHDGASNLTICIATKEGTSSISIGEGEPEDMYLFRDLSDAYDIADLLHMAYQAGLRGEEYEYQFVEERD
jgi:hypothetical protein